MNKSEKKYVVVADYEHAGFQKNQIISRHKSYELARAAAKRSGYDSFRAIRSVDEIEAGA